MPTKDAPSAGPEGQAATKLSIVDRLAARLCTSEDIAREIMDDVYAGLQVHCSIPAGYAHCELGTEKKDIDHMTEDDLRALLAHPSGTIINPHRQHLEAIEFFQMILEGHELVTQDHDSLRPTVGGYLVGPPGVGKTHVMAAFGRAVEAKLASRIANMMRGSKDLLKIALNDYETQMTTYCDTRGAQRVVLTAKGDMQIQKNPAEVFMQKVEEIKMRIRKNRNQPTDMLYLSFKDLCELSMQPGTRKDTLDTIAHAPVVFVDDLDGGSDPEHLAVIQRLIEQRYELGQFGTFLTTNIGLEQVGGADENVRRRILSRSKESFAVLEFNECEDWRDRVKQRRIGLIREEIHSRVAAKYPQFTEQKSP
ncbi:MAG: hypothetical protein Q7S29_03410 [Candidatus Peribacter sp.]|nr:hypothetical protein [Candidatus Peribacter sp.]